MAFEKSKEEMKQEMEALLCALQIAAGRLPMRQGFFSSDADRRQGHLVSCRFLEVLEPMASSIRSYAVVFSGILASLREYEAALLQAEALLGPVGKAAKREGREKILSECQAGLEEIAQRRESAGDFSKAWKAVKYEAESFCEHTLPDFCRRITVLADLEQEGRQASPGGLLQLFGEMRHEVERIFSLL